MTPFLAFPVRKPCFPVASSTYLLDDIACVYTESISRALRVTRQIEAGTIAVNDWYFPAPDTPFGGFKQSGYGREGGIEGLDEYLQTKTIQIKYVP